MIFKWEKISDQEEGFCTYRVKVINGWLVSEAGEGIVFVLDRYHEWKISTIQEEELINAPISSLNLPVRSINSLRCNNIHTVADLINKTARELMPIPNFGSKSLREVKEALAKIGLSLRKE